MEIKRVDHRISERGDHRMVLSHFEHGHAYILAERQGMRGKWTISTHHENVLAEHKRHAEALAELDDSPDPPPIPAKVKDVQVNTRREAVDIMCAMALGALPKEGYAILVPYETLEDGEVLHLRDKL